LDAERLRLEQELHSSRHEIVRLRENHKKLAPILRLLLKNPSNSTIIQNYLSTQKLEEKDLKENNKN